MSFVGKAIGKVVGGITGASAQAKAAQNAANTQAKFAGQGMDALVKYLSPYVNAGTGALGAFGDLLGTNGADKYGAALDMLRSGPEYAALMREGTNSILANASATGGLRGGNVQGALGQFGPALLAQLVNQKLSGYGGLIQNGQNAAGSLAGGIADLLGQKGAALAGGQIARGNRDASAFGSALQIGGLAAGLGGFGGGLGSLFSGGGLAGGAGGGASSFLTGGGLGAGGIGGSLFN